MWVPFGRPFIATLISPGGLDHLRIGARIEIPVTRAIVGYWRAARLDGFVWSVELEAPPAAPLTPGSPGDINYDALVRGLAAGAFQIVWMDGGATPEVEIFVPLFCYSGAGGPWWDGGPDDWPAPDLDAVTPTVEDVAALLRTRTYEDGLQEQTVIVVDDGDREVVTFTDATRPTHDEVARLIDRAVPVVLGQFRPTFPDTLYDEVAHAIALYTAILVEGSYFREQLNESQVALYRDLYGLTVGGVQAAIDLALESAGAGALRLA